MTCGLTRSCSFASWKVVCTPCALTCENGIERALADARLAVVEREDARARDDAQQAARLGRREARPRGSRCCRSTRSVKPRAPPCPVPTAAGRFTAKFGLRDRCSGTGAETARVGVLLVASCRRRRRRAYGKREARRVARRLGEGDVAAPLDTDVAQVAARRLDDARLDQHLRRLRIERAHQLLDVVQVARDVARDERRWCARRRRSSRAASRSSRAPGARRPARS